MFFLTDLDGTLLKDDASMSDYTVEVIRSAMNQGAIVSYATARSYTSSSSVTAKITWKYPLVLYNGALIFDPIKRQVISGAWLSKEITNLIIAEGKRHNMVPLLFCLDNANNEKVFHERLVKEGYIQFVSGRKYKDPRFQEVHQLECSDDYRPLYITYIGNKNELEPLKSSLEMLYKDEIGIHFIKDNYIENHFFLEVSSLKANKKEGLIKWSKLVGCEPEDVTVFGDNLNDIGMFQGAGKKVAVENADPVIKELADEIIESNEEDGVAKYINGRGISYQGGGT